VVDEMMASHWEAVDAGKAYTDRPSPGTKARANEADKRAQNAHEYCRSYYELESAADRKAHLQQLADERIARLRMIAQIQKIQAVWEKVEAVGAAGDERPEQRLLDDTGDEKPEQYVCHEDQPDATTGYPDEERCWCGLARQPGHEVRGVDPEDIRYNLGLPPLDPEERPWWHAERFRVGSRVRWERGKFDWEFHERARSIGWTPPSSERRMRQEEAEREAEPQVPRPDPREEREKVERWVREVIARWKINKLASE
jgi:hypothetical protein